MNHSVSNGPVSGSPPTQHMPYVPRPLRWPFDPPINVSGISIPATTTWRRQRGHEGTFQTREAPLGSGPVPFEWSGRESHPRQTCLPPAQQSEAGTGPSTGAVELEPPCLAGAGSSSGKGLQGARAHCEPTAWLQRTQDPRSPEAQTWLQRTQDPKPVNVVSPALPQREPLHRKEAG